MPPTTSPRRTGTSTPGATRPSTSSAPDPPRPAHPGTRSRPGRLPAPPAQPGRRARPERPGRLRSPTGDKWDNVILGTMLTVVMLVISVIGIRLSARTQVSIGIIEYALLITIAVTGLWWVLTRHPGSFPVTHGWFSFSGIGGKGSLSAGFLLAVFMYSGWDGTLYVNEEVKHRRENPGKAAMTAVIIAAALFILAQ